MWNEKIEKRPKLLWEVDKEKDWNREKKKKGSAEVNDKQCLLKIKKLRWQRYCQGQEMETIFKLKKKLEKTNIIKNDNKCFVRKSLAGYI